MSSIQKENIKVSRTARYFISDKSINGFKNVLFVLHGYGMNAGTFLPKFDTLFNSETLVVAPEGLSRYYKNGFSGDVIASWMTSEDREDEITDYLDYLNAVYDHLVSNPDLKIHVLGFSQGASTASRWVMQNDRKFDSLILWSGEFAPDINKYNTNKPRIFNIIGSNDRFISMERFEKQSKYIEDKGFKVESMTFEGDHNIHQETLVVLWKQLNSEQ